MFVVWKIVEVMALIVLRNIISCADFWIMEYISSKVHLFT